MQSPYIVKHIVPSAHYAKWLVSLKLLKSEHTHNFQASYEENVVFSSSLKLNH